LVRMAGFVATFRSQRLPRSRRGSSNSMGDEGWRMRDAVQQAPFDAHPSFLVPHPS
jgi:hypothetical protein